MGSDKYLFYRRRKEGGEEHHAIAYNSIVMASHIESDYHADGILFLTVSGGAKIKFQHDAQSLYEALKRSGMDEYIDKGEYPRRVSVRLAEVKSASYFRGDEIISSKLVLRLDAGGFELEGGIADHFWDLFRKRNEADAVGIIEEVEREM
jgi:hypothetical protein